MSENIITNNDASYKIEYQEDGVVLLTEYGDTEGVKIDSNLIVYDLKRRNILGMNEAEIKAGIKRRKEIIKIADAQEENTEDSDIFVTIAKDKMSANMTYLPPCNGGIEKSTDDFLTVLKDKWGIAYGIDESTLVRTIRYKEYYKPVLIAQGREPVNGEDGKLVFLFNTEHSYAPKLSEDGSADYKNLNVFESVSEGSEVVTIILPGEGEEGTNVLGDTLEPKPGAAAKIPTLKNVKISEDGKALLATKSGRIDYIRNSIEVNDVYQVKGDVDMSVGNLKFDGDVMVNGNVISGLTINATGAIEVKGYVEAATLIAGKDIVLKNGMQGMGKGVLSAGGNIVARFIEHCEISAKGNITSDYIVHSKAIAGGSILMKGKWGKIVGGHVCAEKEITANEVGSVSNEHTTVELGISPEERSKYSELLVSRDQLREQLEKVNMAVKIYAAKQVSAERQEMRDKLVAAKSQLENQYAQAVKEIEQLDKIMSTSSGARLNATKAVYPNVKLLIDSAMTTTRKIVEHATFKYSKGEVVFTSCEV